MSYDNIIINYGLLKHDIEDEVKGIINPQHQQGLCYLTEQSAKYIRHVASSNRTDFYFSNTTAHGLLWNLIHHAINMDHDNLTTYLNYKGKRQLDHNCLLSFSKCFLPDTPLFLDVTQFFRVLVLSSNLIFNSSNEKLCLAVMVKRSKIENWWTAQDILCECTPYFNSAHLTANKIEDCLNRHSVSISRKKTSPKPVPENHSGYAFYTRTSKPDENGNRCYIYQLRLTELISYFNQSLKNLTIENK